MDKILISFELDSQAKSPLFLRYKLLHAEKINRRPEGGGHRSMSTLLNTPLDDLGYNCVLNSIRPIGLGLNICSLNDSQQGRTGHACIWAMPGGPVWYENLSGVVIHPDKSRHKHRWCC